MKHRVLSTITMVAMTLTLAACGGESSSLDVQAKATQSDLEFSRQFNINCDDFPCTKGGVVKLKMSDYEKTVLDWAGISSDDTKQSFLQKVKRGPGGVGMYGNGSQSHLDVNGRTILLIHLADLDNADRDQYDMYAEFETTPDDSGKILSWGGRIQCSTIDDKTLWQTNACPEPDYLFERQWFECGTGDCKRTTQKVKFRADDFSQSLIDWVDLSGPISPYDFGKKLMDSYDGEIRGEHGSARKYPASYNIAHMHPEGNTTLNEYEVYYLARNQEVYEWGARVRCAPVTETTPWQTTPC